MRIQEESWGNPSGDPIYLSKSKSSWSFQKLQSLRKDRMRKGPRGLRLPLLINPTNLSLRREGKLPFCPQNRYLLPKIDMIKRWNSWKGRNEAEQEGRRKHSLSSTATRTRLIAGPGKWMYETGRPYSNYSESLFQNPLSIKSALW